MPGVTTSPSSKRKRKQEDDENALEIDLSAPEPPSKKALRKAKKKSSDPQVQSAGTNKPDGEDEDEDEDEETPTQTAASKGRRAYGIWIGNLPFFATKDSVRTFLTTHGEFDERDITRIHLPEDPSRRRGNVPQNKGFAYVDFTTNDAVQRAIGLSEGMLSGRRVLIKDANNFEGRPDEHTQPNAASKSSQGKAASAPSRKIFVGNLAFDVTKEMLEEHFSSCGPMAFVHVATFKDSGKCKGYAWVEFDAIESAEAAVRGFTKVPEDDDVAEEESDSDSDSDSNSNSEESGADKAAGKRQKKSKKPREKKVWVNRLMGRTLRMEFAEDATTRYNKRFGKDAKPKDAQEPPIVEERGGTDNTAQTAPRESTKRVEKGGKSHDHGREKSKQGYNGRYSEETVQRLSGAIVGSQGKKTTFD